jgi:hypothetical protein
MRPYMVRKYLITISYSRHATHDPQNVIVNSVDTNLSSGSSRNSRGRENELENSVINSGKVATPAWLMLFWAKGKRINVDTRVRGTGVVLVWLNNVKVRTFTFRESVLAVKLELSGDDRVLTPTVHIEGSLGKNECSGIRESRARDGTTLVDEWLFKRGRTEPFLGGCRTGNINGTRHLEETRRGDKSLGTRGLSRSTEGVESIRKSINGISVVEWLGTKDLEKELGSIKRRAIINVGIRLDNPDEFLDRVVEVELDLVRGRTNRFVTSELNLLNQILVRVLCHLSALIRIKEDVVNIKRSSNKRLLVSNCDWDRTSCGSKVVDSPETLANWADIKVNLDFVILKSNKRKSKSWVSAKPEKKRNVECGLRKSVSWGTHLGRRTRSSARTSNRSKGRISHVGELSGVSNHLEISTLLLRAHCDLVPDVHPVTILTVNSLTSNLNLNLRDELLTNIVKPSGVNTGRCSGSGSSHRLVNLRKSNLEICAVCKISISGDCAGNASAEISLTRERLLN